jgi:hypothetical protein
MRSFTFSLFFSVVINTTFAQTTIPAGAVSGTWQKSGSPYRVLGNIYVAGGQSLTISEGVVVEFQDTWRLDVWGRFSILGKPGDSVHFTPKDKTKGWRGIRVYGQNRKDTLRVQFTKFDYFVDLSYNTSARRVKAVLRVDSLNAPVELRSCRFYNNKFTGSGNLNMTACKVNMDNVHIHNNRAGNDKAGPMISASASAGFFWNCDIDFDSLFINNNNGYVPYLKDDSSFYGSRGSIILFGCLGRVKNSIFRKNYMTGKGAGLHIMSAFNTFGNLTIDNCEFTENMCKYTGAGITMELADQPSSNYVIVKNCTFSKNQLFNWSKSKVFSFRGVDITIFKNSGKAVFENCVFRDGDGEFTFDALGTPLEVKNCTFTGYRSGTISAGQGADVTASNCIIANNGHGVYCGSSTLNLNNCLVVNNKPEAAINKWLNPDGAFGILSGTGGVVNVRNSIVAGHRSNSGAYANLYQIGNGLNIYNSIVEGTIDSIKYFGTPSPPSTYSNVLNVDPGFIAPTAGPGTTYDALKADWRLKNNCGDMSPAFDAGMVISGSPTTDLDNKSRTVGKAIDIGPYEIQSPNAYTLFTSEPADTAVCDGSGAIRTFRNKVIGNQLQYRWQSASDASGPWSLLSGADQSTLGLQINRGSATSWYRLIANNSLCNVADTTKAVKLQILSLPQPNLGPDASVANNGSKLLNPGTFNSYNWSTGASTPTLTVDKNNLALGANTVWVKVKDAKSCENRDTVIITLEPPSAVLSPEVAGIRVYPVPASEVLNIDLPENSSGYYRLSSTEGRLIQTGQLAKNTHIDTRLLPTGIYLLTMEVNGQVYGMKVVK